MNHPLIPDVTREQLVDRDGREGAARVFEETAPLVKRRPDEPLPLVLSTLRYLDPVDAQLYERRPDGDFELAWVRASDSATFTSYLDRGLRVLPEGQTVRGLREADAEASERRRANERKVAEILEANAKAEADRRIAALEEEHARKRAQIDAERDRHLAQMRAGGLGGL